MNALNDPRLSCSSAIAALADHIKTLDFIFVPDGAHRMAPAEVTERKSRIRQTLEQCEQLAREVLTNDALTYQHFRVKLDRLHSLGVWPLMRYVSDVAWGFRWLEIQRAGRI